MSGYPYAANGGYAQQPQQQQPAQPQGSYPPQQYQAQGQYAPAAQYQRPHAPQAQQHHQAQQAHPPPPQASTGAPSGYSTAQSWQPAPQQHQTASSGYPATANTHYGQGSAGSAYSQPSDYTANSSSSASGGPAPRHGAAPTTGFTHHKGALSEESSPEPETAPKVDPSQIPRPDAGEFAVRKYLTRSGLPPPPASSCFIAVDEGNSSPRLIRSSLHQVPNTKELAKATNIALGLVVQPLANPDPNEDPVPVVSLEAHGAAQVLRCRRCHAYVNPNWKFVDNGRRFVCNLCSAPQEVPQYYISNIDGNGRRRDADARPELCRGSYEFEAPADYVTTEPSDPAYVFVVDVSRQSSMYGLPYTLCDSIRRSLDSMAELNPKARVALIAYDSHLHFWRFQGNKPIHLVVTNVDEPFIPAPPESLLACPADPEQRYALDLVLEQLPHLFDPNTNAEAAANAAMARANAASAESVAAQHKKHRADGGGRGTGTPQTASDAAYGAASGSRGTGEPNSTGEKAAKAFQKIKDTAAARLGRDVKPMTAEDWLADCCMGSAAEAAASMLGDTGGKMLVIQAGLPTCGRGALHQREDPASLESKSARQQLLGAQTSFYEVLAAHCAERSISVDLFVCANGYVDVATTETLVKSTGGQIYFYPGFSSERPADTEALCEDVFRNVTRPTGWAGVMTVRCSSGLEVRQHLGHFFLRRQGELELPSIDCDKAFAILLEHVDALDQETEAAVQVALLYTHHLGERRIRVLNLSLPVTSVIANVFRTADLDALINLSLRQVVADLPNSSASEIKAALFETCVDILFTYRKHCAATAASGQLILPEKLKLLPHAVLGLIKNPLLQDTGVQADERAFLLALANSAPCTLSAPFVFPRMYTVHDLDPQINEHGRFLLPAQAPLSKKQLVPHGLVILDDGRRLFLCVGEQFDPQAAAQLFDSAGTGFVNLAQPELLTLLPAAELPEDLADWGACVKYMLDEIRDERPFFPVVRVVGMPKHARGRNMDERLLLDHMIEDTAPAAADTASGGGSAARSDVATQSLDSFLCTLHQSIARKFN